MRTPVRSICVGSIAAFVAAYATLHLPARSAVVYWDLDGTTAGAGGTAPDGTWDGANAFWNASAEGTGATALWQSGDVAAFSAGSNATGSYTITVAGTQSIGGLTFEDGIATLTGGTLELASASEFFVSPTARATVASTITGANGLTKTGNGTLRLTGTNTFTGPVAVSGGVLAVDNAGALGADTTPITVTGSTTKGSSSGQFVLAATMSNGQTLGRDLQLSGGGPSGDGAAFFSIGSNTLNGDITTIGTTRLAAAGGTTTINGQVSIAAGTTTQFVGSGNWVLKGAVVVPTATSTVLEKVGSGTITIDPTIAGSSYGNELRASQGFMRLNAGTGTTLSPSGGTMEIRTDAVDSFGSTNLAFRVQNTTNALFLDRAVGSTQSLINQNIVFGATSFNNSNTTHGLVSRNGYGLTMQGNSAGAITFATGNPVTITNSLTGLLTMAGNLTFTDTSTSARNYTINGNGDTLITGNLVSTAATTPSFIKGGIGLMTLDGIASGNGNTSITGGTLAIRSFTSLLNGTLSLGNGTTSAALTYVGGGETTVRGLIHNTTTANAYLYSSGTGALTLDGPITSGGTGGAKSFVIGGTNTDDNRINSSIPDTGGVTNVLKTGPGTWVLAGTNNYTGTTTVAGGTLKVQDTFSSGSRNVIASTAAVTFGADTFTQAAGGTFEYVGANNAASSESLGTLTPTAGFGTVKVTPTGATGTAALTFGSFGTAGAGSAINLVVPNGGSVTIADRVGGGFVSSRLYFNGSDFAYADATLRAPIYGTDNNFVNTGSSLTPSVHNRLTADVTNGAASVTTLKLDGSVNLNMTGALTVSLGGVLQTGGTSTISGTSLTGGASELTVRVNGSTDALTIATPILTSSTAGLHKNGAGTLTLSAGNAYTGGNYITEGTLRLSGAGNLGSTGNVLVVRQDGRLDLNGNNVTSGLLTGAGNITSTAGGILTVNSSSSGLFSGTLTGNVGLSKSGSGTLSLSGTNSQTGVTQLNAGTLAVTSLADIGVASGIGAGNTANNAGSLVFNGGILQYTGATSAIYQATQTPSVSIDRLFTLAGTGGTIQSSGTWGNAVLAASSNHASLIFRNTGDIAFSGSGDRTLTLGGTSTGDNEMRVHLIDNPNAGGGKLNLTKSDAGLWILNPATPNTYTGVTTINLGALQANEGQGLSSASNLYLNGGVLQTSGTFARSFGTDAGKLQFGGSGGGFAASSSKLTVNLGGNAAPIVWGDGTTGLLGTLILGSGTSLAETELVNPIDLNGTARTIQIDDNANTSTDYTVLSGVISGTANLTKAGGGLLYLTGNNTYVGNTAINGGTVVVRSVGGTGSTSSSLGAGGTTLTIGSGGTTGALNYLGSGEVTDRTIIMGGTTGGTVLESNGTGALIVNNLVSLAASGAGAGSKTLTLRGYNTDGNEIRSKIEDNSAGVTTLVSKTEGGTWILSGANTYTGNTSIGAGALGAGHDSAFGASLISMNSGTLFAAGADRTLANAITLSGNTTNAVNGNYSLTLNGAILYGSTSGSNTLNNFIVGGEELVIAGTVTNNDSSANRLFTIGGTGNTRFTGTLLNNATATGTASLSVTSSGLTTLSGANNYTGTTTLNSPLGTLRLIGNTAISSALTVNAGTLQLDSSMVNDVTLTSLATGGGAAGSSANIVIGAGRTLNLGATVSYSSTNNNLTATIGGPGALNLGSGTVTFTINNSTSAAVDMALTPGTLSGSGTLVKAGTGTLQINPTTNNFTGAIQIDAGSIFGLGTLTNHLIFNGGVYEGSGSFTRTLAATAGPNTLQWAANATGGFAALGGNLTVNLNPAGPLVWNSTPGFVNGTGSITLGSANADAVVDWQDDIDLNNGTTAVTRTINVTDNLVATVTTDRAILSGVLSNSGTGAATLNKAGTGELELTGANTFTGGVTVTAGTLIYSTVSDNGGAASNLGRGTDGLTLSGGTLQFAGNTNQSTNRAMSLTASSFLNASGTNNATITYNGLISTSAAATLNLLGTGTGIIAGGFQQNDTSLAADLNVNGGTWTLRGSSLIADDLVVTNAGSVMNLEGTGSITWGSGSTSNGLYARAGGILSLQANDVTSTAAGLDFILLGYDGTTGAAGVLNTNTFNLTTPRLDIGRDANGEYIGEVLGTGTVTVGTNLNLYRGRITANLAGAGAAAKNGASTVTLSGSSAGRTGTTAVNNGVLILNYETSNTDKLGSGALTLAGGELVLEGNDGADTVQAVTGAASGINTTFNTGASRIVVNAGTGRTASFDLGTISTTATGRTVDFVTSAGGSIATSTANTNASLLGGWATHNGTNFATVAGGKIVAALSTAKDDVASWLGTDDVVDDVRYTGTLASGGTVNSIKFNSSNAASAVTIGADSRLVVGSGGILVTQNAGAGLITGGYLGSNAPLGTSAVNRELFVHQYNTDAAFTIASAVQGSVALTKSGLGTLVLSGDNTYGLQTTLNEGTLRLQGGKAIGDRSVVVMKNASDVLLDLNNTDETIGALSMGALSNGQTDSPGVNIGTAKLTLLNHSGAAQTYAGVFTGSGTIIKSGLSPQYVTGNSTNFTGNVIVNQGEFRLASTAGAMPNVLNYEVNANSLFMIYQDQSGGNVNRVNNAAAVRLNNTGSTGTRGFWISTNQNIAAAETVGVVTLGAGHNLIELDTQGGTSTSRSVTLTLTGLERQNHSTLLIQGHVLGAAASPRTRLLITNATNATLGGVGGTAVGTPNIAIIPYMLGASAAADATNTVLLSLTGDNFVTYDATNGIRPLNTTTEYTQNEAGYNALSGLTTNNVRFTASPAAPLTGGTKRINALLLDSATAALTINGAATDELTISSGAILATTTTAANGISLGGFRKILAGPSNEYLVYVTNAANTFTIDSALASSSAALTKAGPGTLVLTNANSTYGGGTWFNQGDIQADALNKLGTGALNFMGGGLRFGAAFDPSTRAVTFGAGGGSFDTNGFDITVANSIGRGGLGSFTKTGTGRLTLNAPVNYAGTTFITGGTLSYGVAGALPASMNVELGSATLDIGAFATTLRNLTMAGNGTITGSADLNFTGELATDGGNNRTVTINNTGLTRFSGAHNYLVETGTTSRSLTIAGSGNVQIEGNIHDGSGVGVLSYTGTGTLTLSGANTYTGATTLNNAAGTLVLSGSNSSAGTTTLTNGLLQLNNSRNGGLATGTLTLTGGRLQSIGGPQTLSNAVVVSTATLEGTNSLNFTGKFTGASGGSRTVTNNLGSGASLTIGSIDLTADASTTVRTFTLAGSGNTLIAGAINNGTAATVAHNFTITNTGTTTLTGAVGAIAATTLNTAGSAGTLQLDGAGQLSGTVNINAGTLKVLTTGSNQSIGTLNLGGGAAGSSSTVEIGSGRTLALTGLGYSATNNNAGAVIDGDAGSILDLGGAARTFTVADSTNATFDVTIGPDITLQGSDLIKAGAGTLLISGTNNLTGAYEVQGGALTGNLGTNHIHLNGGVVELNGNFNRPLGTGVGEVRFGTNGGGFSARGGNLNVTLAGVTNPLVWGVTPNFVPTGAPLVFGSGSADSTVSFNHDINLNNTGAALVRTFHVADNPNSTTDKAVIAGVLSNSSGAAGILKTGPGVLELSQVNSYTGATTINDGTLRFTQSQTLTGALEFGSANTVTTAGTLDLSNASLTVPSLSVRNNTTAVNNLLLGTGQTLLINGDVKIGTNSSARTTTNFTATGGGDLIVLNSAGNGVFRVGGSETGTGAGTGSTVTADFSGLGSMFVQLNTSTGTFAVSSNTSTNTAGVMSIARFAPTTNITTNLFVVGDGGGNGAANVVNQVVLGNVENNINANTFTIGGGTGNHRDLGSVVFGSAGGTIKIRNAAGTGRAAFNMGTGTTATGVSGATGNTFDVTGHQADLLLGAVNIGMQNSRTSDLVNTFSWDRGVLDMQTLAAASRASTSPTPGSPRTTTVTINLGSAASTLADNANITGGITTFGSATTNDSAVDAILNVKGGTVNIGATDGVSVRMAASTIIADGVKTASSADVELNFTGGVTNLAGDIIKVGGAGNSSTLIRLDGGELNLNGNSISTDSFIASSGVLRGLDGLSAGNGTTALPLNKIGTGTLTFEGNVNYAGPTQVTAGRLVVNGNLNGSPTVDVDSGAVLAGSGAIQGAVTIDSGATLIPGLDAGLSTATFGTGPLDLQAGATLKIDIDSSTALSDLLVVTGALSLAGTNDVSLQVTDLGAGTLPEFSTALRLAKYTIGNGVGGVFSVNGVPMFDYNAATFDPMTASYFTIGNNHYVVDYDFVDGADKYVALVVVPEPGALGALAAREPWVERAARPLIEAARLDRSAALRQPSGAPVWWHANLPNNGEGSKEGCLLQAEGLLVTSRG